MVVKKEETALSEEEKKEALEEKKPPDTEEKKEALVKKEAPSVETPQTRRQEESSALQKALEVLDHMVHQEKVDKENHTPPPKPKVGEQEEPPKKSVLQKIMKWSW